MVTRLKGTYMDDRGVTHEVIRVFEDSCRVTCSIGQGLSHIRPLEDMRLTDGASVDCMGCLAIGKGL